MTTALPDSQYTCRFVECAGSYKRNIALIILSVFMSLERSSEVTGEMGKRKGKRIRASRQNTRMERSGGRGRREKGGGERVRVVGNALLENNEEGNSDSND